MARSFRALDGAVGSDALVRHLYTFSECLVTQVTLREHK
jgi:hypothetical protein